jgi:hypothetical protein
MNQTNDLTGTADRERVDEVVLAGAAGLSTGLLFHLIAVLLRDRGPEIAGWSLRGDGATAVLIIATVVLVAGAIGRLRRGARLGALLWSVTFIAGLFIVAGGF